MSDANRAAPDPTVIFDAFNAYQRTEALKGAVELEIFTHIAEGANTAVEIAKRCHASDRGVRILCDYLTIQGFLTKIGNTYGLSVDSSAFLNKRSPTYIGSVAFFLGHPHHRAHFQDLAAAVRKGGSTDVGNMGPDDPVWVEFAKVMAPLMGIVAETLAKMVVEATRPMKVLDIAASHGLYGISIAKHNAEAEIVAVDWGNVLEVTKENANKAGVADRYRMIPGSAFDVDFGNGYDLVLLPAFLHHFDPPTNVGLLKKIHSSMKPGGLLATQETIPNDDRVSPPTEAAFSLMMLCSTPAGEAYTFRELDQMLIEAGFHENKLHGLGALPVQVIFSRA
jgi:2-polyprenyl-3-methyl-5-hydroxy-6-metoxy-1,4-benzoquinol methylase